jgi:hypothetical protein
MYHVLDLMIWPSLIITLTHANLESMELTYNESLIMIF